MHLYLTLLYYTYKERENARKLFSGTKGTELYASLSATVGGASGVALDVVGTSEEEEQTKKGPSVYRGPSPEEVRRIQEALKGAKTLDEITRLERQLQTGGQMSYPQR